MIVSNTSITEVTWCYLSQSHENNRFISTRSTGWHKKGDRRGFIFDQLITVCWILTRKMSKSIIIFFTLITEKEHLENNGVKNAVKNPPYYSYFLCRHVDLQYSQVAIHIPVNYSYNSNYSYYLLTIITLNILPISLLTIHINLTVRLSYPHIFWK